MTDIELGRALRAIRHRRGWTQSEVAAKAGHTVVLRSRKKETADEMVAKLAKSLGKQVEKGRLDEAERDAVLGRVSATDDLQALAKRLQEPLEIKYKPFDLTLY